MLALILNFNVTKRFHYYIDKFDETIVKRMNSIRVLGYILFYVNCSNRCLIDGNHISKRKGDHECGACGSA